MEFHISSDGFRLRFPGRRLRKTKGEPRRHRRTVSGSSDDVQSDDIQSDSELSQASTMLDEDAAELPCPSHAERRGLADFSDALQNFAIYTLTAWTLTVAMNLEYQWHVQAPALRDIGFELLFELPPHAKDVTEHMFHSILIGSILGAFVDYRIPSPVRAVKPRWDLISGWLRCMSVLNLLRPLSFLVTQLPGPAEHCRPGSLTYNPPVTIFERANFQKGCGDLLFSGHTMTLCSCAMVLHGVLKGHRLLRAALWLYVVVFAVLVVAARKHYTVDVVIALYTAPLVYNRFSRSWLGTDEAVSLCRRELPGMPRVAAIVGTLLLSAWLWLHLTAPAFRDIVSLPALRSAAWLVQASYTSTLTLTQ